MNWEIFKNRPWIIAHRGDTKAGVENTMPAIESALRLGADGVEVDLRRTRDGHVVLFHDDTLQRLAGRPERIEDLPLAEVRKISLKGAAIPMLEDLLESVKDRALLNLELKTVDHCSGTLERAVVETVRRSGLSENILFSSFQPWTLWRLRRLAPEIRRGVLFESKPFLHRLLTPFTRPWAFHSPLDEASPELVAACRRRGQRFLVWTVNDGNDMKRLIEFGVDGLITDEPRKLIDIVKEQTK